MQSAEKLGSPLGSEKKVVVRKHSLEVVHSEYRKDFYGEPGLHSLAESDGESPSESGTPKPLATRRLGRQESPLSFGASDGEVTTETGAKARGPESLLGDCRRSQAVQTEEGFSGANRALAKALSPVQEHEHGRKGSAEAEVAPRGPVPIVLEPKKTHEPSPPGKPAPEPSQDKAGSPKEKWILEVVEEHTTLGTCAKTPSCLCPEGTKNGLKRAASEAKAKRAKEEVPVLASGGKCAGDTPRPSPPTLEKKGAAH